MNIISSNSDSKIEQLKKKKRNGKFDQDFLFCGFWLLVLWMDFCIELLDLHLKNEINEEKNKNNPWVTLNALLFLLIDGVAIDPIYKPISA